MVRGEFELRISTPDYCAGSKQENGNLNETAVAFCYFASSDANPVKDHDGYPNVEDYLNRTDPKFGMRWQSEAGTPLWIILRFEIQSAVDVPTRRGSAGALQSFRASSQKQMCHQLISK